MKISISQVRQAAARLAAAAVLYTPILRNDFVDAATGTNVFFKCEHLQHTGSFKLRGATNAVESLDEVPAQAGVVAHSSGNHGAAVARAAQRRGIPASVVVPTTTPKAKIANMELYGAEVILCEPTQRARTETSRAIADETGGTFLHPYDDPLVMAGQGTIGLEILDQVPDVDAVLVPVSGGGMISGIAVAIKALRPEVRVIACEPAGKDLRVALTTSTRVLDEDASNAALDTIADAIRTKSFGPLPWEAASTLLDPTVLSVTDAEIRAAMRISLFEMKQGVEPAGAVCLAALLSPAFATVRDQGIAGRPLRNVAAVVCGGNVDPGLLLDVLSDA